MRNSLHELSDKNQSSVTLQGKDCFSLEIGKNLRSVFLQCKANQPLMVDRLRRDKRLFAIRADEARAGRYVTERFYSLKLPRGTLTLCFHHCASIIQHGLFDTY